MIGLPKARLADLVVELWDRNAKMRGRLVRQQREIERLTARVKRGP